MENEFYIDLKKYRCAGGNYVDFGEAKLYVKKLKPIGQEIQSKDSTENKNNISLVSESGKEFKSDISNLSESAKLNLIMPEYESSDIIKVNYDKNNDRFVIKGLSQGTEDLRLEFSNSKKAFDFSLVVDENQNIKQVEKSNYKNEFPKKIKITTHQPIQNICPCFSNSELKNMANIKKESYKLIKRQNPSSECASNIESRNNLSEMFIIDIDAEQRKLLEQKYTYEFEILSSGYIKVEFSNPSTSEIYKLDADKNTVEEIKYKDLEKENMLLLRTSGGGGGGAGFWKDFSCEIKCGENLVEIKKHYGKPDETAFENLKDYAEYCYYMCDGHVDYFTSIVPKKPGVVDIIFKHRSSFRGVTTGNHVERIMYNIDDDLKIKETSRSYWDEKCEISNEVRYKVFGPVIEESTFERKYKKDITDDGPIKIKNTDKFYILGDEKKQNTDLQKINDSLNNNIESLSIVKTDSFSTDEKQDKKKLVTEMPEIKEDNDVGEDKKNLNLVHVESINFSVSKTKKNIDLDSTKPDNKIISFSINDSKEKIKAKLNKLDEIGLRNKETLLNKKDKKDNKTQNWFIKFIKKVLDGFVLLIKKIFGGTTVKSINKQEIRHDIKKQYSSLDDNKFKKRIYVSKIKYESNKSIDVSNNKNKSIEHR